jgi:hypothetical protein
MCLFSDVITCHSYSGAGRKQLQAAGECFVSWHCICSCVDIITRTSVNSSVSWSSTSDSKYFSTNNKYACLYRLPIAQTCKTLGNLPAFHSLDRDTGWTARVRFPAGAEIFLFTTPNPLSNRYFGDLSLGVRRPERKLEHSPLSTSSTQIYPHSVALERTLRYTLLTGRRKRSLRQTTRWHISVEGRDRPHGDTSQMRAILIHIFCSLNYCARYFVQFHSFLSTSAMIITGCIVPKMIYAHSCSLLGYHLAHIRSVCRATAAYKKYILQREIIFMRLSQELK